jgi:preprotein translocase subunit SecE
MPNYFKDVRAEMKHVSWPSRRQAAVYTAIVVAVSLGIAVYLGLLDYLFTTIIQKII